MPGEAALPAGLSSGVRSGVGSEFGLCGQPRRTASLHRSFFAGKCASVLAGMAIAQASDMSHRSTLTVRSTRAQRVM